jgi:hypothetical protein
VDEECGRVERTAAYNTQPQLRPRQTAKTLASRNPCRSRHQQLTVLINHHISLHQSPVDLDLSRLDRAGFTRGLDRDSLFPRPRFPPPCQLFTMSSLRLATASNVRAFQNLTAALSTGDRKWAHAIDQEALEDEIGRFRVWAGNLGALQKGHSSLDYRLRDSPVSNTNTLKLLKELETNINEAYAVVSGARLPYEEQPRPNMTEDDDDDDGFFSAEEDDEDSSCDEPRSELKMRFAEIVDIIDNLYKLSVRIRTPGLRSRSLRASSYTQKDPETGIDIFDMYAVQDLKHVHELVSHLRQPYVGDDRQEEPDSLTKRLSASVTLRRRHFKYWKRRKCMRVYLLYLD